MKLSVDELTSRVSKLVEQSVDQVVTTRLTPVIHEQRKVATVLIDQARAREELAERVNELFTGLERRLSELEGSLVELRADVDNAISSSDLDTALHGLASSEELERLARDLRHDFSRVETDVVRDAVLETIKSVTFRPEDPENLVADTLAGSLDAGVTKGHLLGVLERLNLIVEPR